LLLPKLVRLWFHLFLAFSLEEPVAHDALKTWAGKWALITGASAGIGLEFAKLLAVGGANLVLTARRSDRLQNIASELSTQHGVKIEIVSADLLRPEAPTEIFNFTSGKNIEVELLINNAGFGAFGYVHEIPVEKMLEMIQVNCSAVVRLTRLYLPLMVARKHGVVPGGAVQHCLRCHEGFRPFVRGGRSGRVARFWCACLRALPWDYQHRISAGR